MTLSQFRVSRAACRLHGEDGIALLEVMMASVILVTTLIGLALLFSYGASYVAAEGGERVSLFLAQQRLEELRAMGLGRATAETDRPIPGFPGFVRTTTIVGGTDLDGSGTNPRIITVSVRSLIREAGPISVSTLYARH
jgi:Tfp pilus assembly protein PilV